MREVLEVAARQLWKLLVLWPAWLLTPEGRKTLLSRAVLRRAIVTVGVTLLFVGLTRTFPPDVALVFAGDIMTYVEVVAIAWAASTSGAIGQGVKLAVLAVTATLRRLAARGRAARRPAPRRRPGRLEPPANDEGPAWGGLPLAA